MVWCSYCAQDQIAEADDINGFTCCTGCGRVLDDNVYSSEPTFTKGADGQSSVQGSFIRDRQYSNYSAGGEGHAYATDSHERTLERGRNEISDIADFLVMSSREDAVNAAHRLYIIAVERNFTRGRRTNQVAAACLYIICRQEQKPFLLIDFSDCLQVNVYILGAVFLQLCRLLSLEEHHIMQKPVDPSLFIHRFTDRLLRNTRGSGKRGLIANTALRLVASMKRDWIQTGRRPSGICGAALFISAHIHGFECTKTDVVSVVHICEGTLTQRLIEFEKTDSGSLTAEEFELKAKEYDSVPLLQPPLTKIPVGDCEREVLCEHKVQGAAHFAIGLCKACYEEFVKASGGMDGGAAPPAFQESERKRADAHKKEEEEEAGGELLIDWVNARKKKWKGNAKGKSGNHDGLKTDHLSRGDGKGTFEKKKGVSKDLPQSPIAANEGGKRTDTPFKKHMDMSSSGTSPDRDSENLSPCHKGSGMDDSASHLRAVDIDKSQTNSDEPDKPADILSTGEEQADTLSDIDDDEVDGYLHNQEEVRLKTMIWTEMNKEYLEAQQAKQEALAAAQAAQEAVLRAAGADSAELLAATVAAVAEKKKVSLQDRKRRREEAKSKGPAESATEAARQMLQSKRLSSKVNYSALEKLFDGEVSTEAKMHREENAKDDTKDKHVKWADSVVSKEDLGGGKSDDKIFTNAQAEKGMESQEEEEEQEDEDEDVEEYGANLEDEQLHYGEEDFGDDDYDEY